MQHLPGQSLVTQKQNKNQINLMSIYIFSRPIRSGKTSELLQWCDNKENMRGILMPDINNCRKMFDIETKEYFDAECTSIPETNDSLVTAGKFNFYAAAFKKANDILTRALSQDPDWVIIDEAGKLELNGEGFYSSVADAITLYSNHNKAGNLLITIRDSLCDETIRFFKIQNYTLINSLENLSAE